MISFFIKQLAGNTYEKQPTENKLLPINSKAINLLSFHD